MHKPSAIKEQVIVNMIISFSTRKDAKLIKEIHGGLLEEACIHTI